MAIGTPASGTGGTANTNVDTNVTVPIPGTVNNGDLVIVVLGGANATATAPTINTLAGWTRLDSAPVDGTAPQLTGGIFTRFRQPGDTSSPVWTFSGGSNFVAGVICYPGVDPTTPITGFVFDAYTGTNTAKSTTSITTAGGWLVTGFIDRNGGVYTGLADTLRVTSTHSSGPSLVIQDSNGNVTAGPQVRTATGPSTSVGLSFAIGLNAAAAAGAPIDTVTTAVSALDMFPAADPVGRLLFRLGTGINVAHRGLSASAVEHSPAAYQLCDALGIIAREVSVWRSSDGVWIASHDRTTGRVFGSGQNIDIPTNTWAAIQAATAAGTTVGGHPIAKLVDLINASPVDKVWWVDNKNSTNVTDFLDTLDAFPNAQGRFIIKAVFNSTVPVTARARGYRSWGYWYEADLTQFDTYKGNFHYHGLDYLASPAAWAQVLADNKPVLSHVILTTAAYNTGMTLGAIGAMSGLAATFPNAQTESVAVAMSAFDMAPTGVPTGTAGATASLTLSASGVVRAPDGGTASLDLTGNGLARPPGGGVASLSLLASGTGLGPGGAAANATLTLTAGVLLAVFASGTASLTLNASGTSRADGSAFGSLSLFGVGFAADATFGSDIIITVTLSEQGDLPEVVQWRLPAETKEWVGPIAVDANGEPVETFELTLTKDAARPASWRAPLKLSGGRGLLVGLGTDFPLSVGHRHTLWVRFTAMPESPVQKIGMIRVY